MVEVTAAADMVEARAVMLVEATAAVVTRAVDTGDRALTSPAVTAMLVT